MPYFSVCVSWCRLWWLFLKPAVAFQTRPGVSKYRSPMSESHPDSTLAVLADWVLPTNAAFPVLPNCARRFVALDDWGTCCDCVVIASRP